LEAVAARIFPTTDTPGAKEAGAVTYIDRALAEAYRTLLPRYQRGLRGLDRYCRSTLGKSFVDLSESQQDTILSDLEAGKVLEVRDGAEFFELLRSHVMEGIFGEPSYGGNRDLVGWRLVGFPGQRFGYPDAYIDRVVDLPPVAVDEMSKPEE
jgi:gluconate 2-dehydrogenase gamma chain